MDIFGVGPMEVVLIVLLVLIIYGPKDLQKAGREIGRGLNKLVNSEIGQIIFRVSRRAKTLPQTLMREAKREEASLMKEITKDLPVDRQAEQTILPSPEMPAGTPTAEEASPDQEKPQDK